MPSYAAFLGHQPHLSVAELTASVPGFSLSRIVEGVAALFESSADLEGAFLSSVGGTVLIARRVTEAPVTIEDVPKLLLNELKDTRRGKVTFSLRAVGLPHPAVRTLYRQCKDAIRKQGRPCRYVGNEHKPALPVLLHDTGLIDGKRGCELVLIAEEESLWVGRTIAAQDVNAYTKRDMKKPVRDTTTGLLPPKLAQILLNFGAWLVESRQPPLPPNKKRPKKAPPLTVFDPFCGTGVIPLEGLLRGWHVLASDISQKAVNGCEKNIEWLRKEEKILKKDAESSVFKQDALKPFTLKHLPDVVVTETTLGPAIADRLAVKAAQKLKTESERLQAAFLKNCAATLPGVPLCLVWPVWKIKNDQIFLERVWQALDEAGYRATLPPGVEPSIAGRLSLLYRRPDQYVGREIVLLLPKRKK